MNLIKLSAVAVILSAFSISAQAQNVKPKFKKFLYVTYGFSESYSGSKIIIAIEDFVEFNADGTLHYVSNRSRHNVFGLTDTTYKIPDSLMIAFNKVFNGKKKLKSYVVADTLKTRDESDWRVYFVDYTANNNTSDNFLVIKQFLDKDIAALLDKILDLPHSNVIQKHKFYHNSSIEAQIIEYQKACKCIPGSSPPTIKQLEIASPPTNH